MLVEWVTPPPVPVIVSGYVPTGAFGLTDTVSLVLPEPATDDGLNEALARAGNPLMLKLTVAENDPTGETVTM